MAAAHVSGRILLRPFTADDRSALLAYRNDPEAARYQGWSLPFTEADANAFLEAVQSTTFGTPGEWKNLVIERRATGDVVGDVAFRVEPDGQTGQIGFTLAPAYRGEGLAGEAVSTLCDLAFEKVPLLFAITDARNAAAIRLLERLGFRNKGHHARGVLFKGELCDELRFERERRRIAAVPIDEPSARRLLEAYFAELHERFGAYEPPTPAVLEEDAARGAVLVLHDAADRPVACGSLRLLSPERAEVKRMFVVADARGRGHARVLLRALEDAARERGCEEIVLDTASTLHEAAHLYVREGYEEVERYNDNPYAARWFQKKL